MIETLFKSIRARLYGDIARYLLDSELFQYVDLWNNQWQHLDEEKIVRFPCIFVEFADIRWMQIGRHCQRGDVTLNLHVGVKARGRTAAIDRTVAPAIEYFELLDALHCRMRDLCLPYAGTFTRTASSTDHDHDDIIANTETYVVGITDTSTERSTTTRQIAVEIGKTSIEKPHP